MCDTDERVYLDTAASSAVSESGLLLNRDGELFILEHKTRSNLSGPGSNFTESLSMNHQALFYIVLLNSLGRNPAGFLYNVAAKPQHRTGDFPALKQRMYKAILTDPDKYLHLEAVYVEETAIKRAKAHLERALKMMDDLSPSTVTMSPARCTDYEGCQFRELCQNRADASDPASIQSLPQLQDFFYQDTKHHARHSNNTRRTKTTKR